MPLCRLLHPAFISIKIIIKKVRLALIYEYNERIIKECSWFKITSKQLLNEF